MRAPHIAVLRKAMLYDKGQRRVEKSQKAQKVSRCAQVPRAVHPPIQIENRSSLVNVLQKGGGSRGDAANLIEQRVLNDGE